MRKKFYRGKVYSCQSPFFLSKQEELITCTNKIFYIRSSLPTYQNCEFVCIFPRKNPPCEFVSIFPRKNSRAAQTLYFQKPWRKNTFHDTHGNNYFSTMGFRVYRPEFVSYFVVSFSWGDDDGGSAGDV